MSNLDLASGTATTPETSVYRQILRNVVCACLLETGFQSAAEDAIETLTEMLNSFLQELGHSTKTFCEVSGRTEPTVTDAILAMVEMGVNVQSLPAYGRRQSRTFLPPATPNPNPSEQKRLQLGTQLPRPSHIPDYLPEYPDAHCYIRTLTHAAPATGYKNIREKAAKNKRDVMKALTKFIAKTGDTENLFPDDPYAFPLIADKPKPMPYLDSPLARSWEEFDLLENDLKQQQPNHHHAQDDKDAMESHRFDRSDSYVSVTGHSRTDVVGGTGVGGLEGVDADNLIDNPFLRPINMPGTKTGSKKYKF